MPEPVDWSAIEQLLVDAATKALATVSSTEPFYGAIFDVEPTDGRVALLLNTERHLTEEWGKPIATTDLHYRFMPSCFESRFRLTKGVKAFPAAAIEALTEQDIEEDRTDAEGSWATTGALLDTCCRVALRLEASAFAKLPRTPDFRIAVTPDPSEPGDFSVARYAKFKKRAAKTTKPTSKAQKKSAKPVSKQPRSTTNK